MFALAYFSELQKTANYQVIPVGTVEVAIRENELDMSSPADVVKLAKILDADAVVVGAVTHYIPYYPPQMGVHIQWYSPRDWIFYPGISTGEESGQEYCPPGDCPPANGPPGNHPSGVGPPIENEDAPAGRVVRGQSRRKMPMVNPIVLRPLWGTIRNQTRRGFFRQVGGESASRTRDLAPRIRVHRGGTIARRATNSRRCNANGAFNVQTQQAEIQPVMSYTRFFDGADRHAYSPAAAGTYFMRGDMRSGGWEAYLHRSDDFLQFASHVLVIEMLELHGGPLKTEKVLLYGR